MKALALLMPYEPHELKFINYCSANKINCLYKGDDADMRPMYSLTFETEDQLTFLKLSFGVKVYIIEV